MDLYNLLNVDKQSKKTSSNQVTSIEGKIKKRINEVIHETLLNEFPQYYKNIDTTTIAKSSDGKLSNLNDVSGYRLLVPIDDKVEIENGSKKVTFENAVKVASPQIYLQGIKNNVCEYVKIGGKTTLWNKKKNDFIEK
tara:strand:- start:743 stop:1156 length:414 start_codon:yes stop_codon:yes gene_type:complete